MGMVANGADVVSDDLDEIAEVPRHFWLVLLGGLLWNGFGAVDYVLTNMRNPTYMARSPADMGRWLDQMPQTVHGCWAVGVWGSLAGSLLMAARMRQAGLAFMLSFIAAATSYGWQFAQGLPVSLDTFGFRMMAASILATIFGLWWYARSMFWYGVLK